MDTTSSDFYTRIYIPAIKKLAFHIPHMCILSTNHCGEMWRIAFKQRELFHYFLCHRDYAERLVARFSNQIRSKYYGGNISVSIEGIALEHFNSPTKIDINSTTPSRQRHTVFHYFLSNYRKQYSDTTTAHSKRLISLL